MSESESSNTDAEDHELEELDEDARELEIEEMESWFRERYEDPAQRTPYESAEGGYIWVFGGPYDAEEVLREQFEGEKDEDLIEELARRLDRECPEWTPKSDGSEYDEGLFDAVSSNSLSARETLGVASDDIEQLLDVQVPAFVEGAHSRLLFANAIAALESYLSDVFINRVVNDDSLIQRYLDSEPHFTEKKIRYKDVLRESKNARDEIKKTLLELVWHHLGKVRLMFRDVLEVEFGDISSLMRSIQKRHDIVHRNGRQKDGTLVVVSKSDVRDLVNEISALADRVEDELIRDAF